jgi:protease-4
MGDMAASGAYWIASGTDKIWASRSTITGSIGVVWELVRVEELYRKLGIEVDVIKSGPHKDIGSSVRDMQEEERQILQDLVDDVFEQFVTQIVEGRDMQRQDVIKLADGRIFSGRQAHELGLVDELGNFDDAVRDAARLSGLSAWHIKEYGRLSPLERLLAGQVRAPELPGAQEITGNRVLDIAWILRQMLMIPSSQPTK